MSPVRPSAAARRVGYAIGIAVDVMLLWLINIWPGWSAVPFLTDETPRVLGLLDAALVVGAAVNVAYLGYDARWFVALGGLVTTSVGLAGLVLVWQVFPFAFAGAAWAEVARILLVMGIVGSVVALVADAVRLLLQVLADPSRTRHGHAGR